MNTTIRAAGDFLENSDGPKIQPSGRNTISGTGTPACLVMATGAALVSSVAGTSAVLFPNFFFDPVLTLASLLGVYFSLLSLFRVRGFHRLVATLSAVVSLYALIQCISFLRWAIDQR
jgi:hypothetical protein